MTDKEQKLLSEYTEEMKKIYGNSLRYVILYGSRARGDFREDSDYDIMVLVDLSDKKIKSLDDHKLDVDCKYFNQYDMYITAFVRNIDFFNKWVRAHPFYNNVWNEGVALYDYEKRAG